MSIITKYFDILIISLSVFHNYMVQQNYLYLDKFLDTSVKLLYILSVRK